MIRLEKLSIHNFRGIRELDLGLAGKNFAIQGPNGSGKSGVVDALEFVLTGSITRLTGPGTGGLTTTKHGPHVDYRDNPRESTVSLEATVIATGAKVTVERSAEKPRVVRLTPDDAPTRAVFERLAKHPEFVLSRREVIKYILVEAGKRASEIQSLLKLERVNRFRGALKTASNTLAKARDASETLRKTSREALNRALGLSTITKEAVLAEVNKIRSAAGLDALEDLNPTIRVDAGVRTEEKPKTQPLSRKVLLEDLKALRDLYGSGKPAALVTTLTEFNQKHATLLSDPALLQDIEAQQFFELGLKRFDGKACPFCSTAWDDRALRDLIKQALARLAAGRDLSTRLETLAVEIRTRAQTIERPVKALSGAAASMKRDPDHRTLVAGLADLQRLQGALATPLAMLNLDTRDLGILETLPSNVDGCLTAMQASIESLPIGPSQAEAKATLVEVQMRLEEARSADRNFDRARKHADRAALALKIFDDTVETYLNKLYEQVEGRFTSYYQLVNPDDEAAFKAQIQHASGSVDISVDFYGRGLFPPVAYHSEGHQDGMGLCLYLALMEQVLGSSFSFCVLDDVVMSVDSSHRKEVCRLLKEKFPNTQFIITTHDRVWLAQMRNHGLLNSKSALNFNRWTVDHGPFVSEAKEAWEKIDALLASGDVHGAAGLLRRTLEEIAYELADRFGVDVPLRLDGGYELGELLPRVTKHLSTRLGEAAAAAQSWGDGEAHTAAVERRRTFADAVAASNVEQWAINKAVHYNEWENFSKQDFGPVVEAFKDLVAKFRCGACGGWFYPEPKGRKAETIRCECGRNPLNLLAKSGK
jgi:energy-coupling factor transporter ATP-binding protein EcfA2